MKAYRPTDEAALEALAPLHLDPSARFTLRAHALLHDGESWSSNDRFTMTSDAPLAEALDAIAARFAVFQANYDDTAEPCDLVTLDAWQPFDDETAGLHIECNQLAFVDVEATGTLTTLAPYLDGENPPTLEDLDGIRQTMQLDRVSFTEEEFPAALHAARLAACDAWQAHLEATAWTVTVGNIGTTYHGTNEEEARANYAEYCEQSRTNYGRAGREPVTLCLAGEPLEEFNP